MAITITNSLALLATHQLNKNQSALNQSLMRLSTGFRINSAADDPAGLIASEYLRSEMATTSAAITNAQRADSILATADGALGEVSNLLISLQGLVTASANTAGLSPDEIDANQLQVDSIISSINRISQSARFAGRPLLSGDFAYQLSAGPNAAALKNIQVHSASVPAGGVPVSVQVLSSAQRATLVFHGGGSGLSGPVRLSISGLGGNTEFSLASSTSVATIATTINQLTYSTGVYASASGNDVTLLSTDFGSRQFVSVTSDSSAFQTQNSAGTNTQRASGRDATVTVNGETIVAHGLALDAHSNFLTASFLLDPAQNTNGATAQFSITGGGASFALLDAVRSNAESIALPSMNSGSLGYVPQTTGYLALSDLLTGAAASLTSGHLANTQQIVSNAIKDVSRSRATIGAFRAYNIQSDINFLNIKYENLSSAESAIRDTDFATETANLAREQVLAASSQFVLKAAQQSQDIIVKLLGV